MCACSSQFFVALTNVILLQCRRQVDRAEAQAFADENGLSYVEASAKNADGVDEAFMSTCEKVYDNMKNGVFSRRNTTRTDGGGEVSAVDVDSCSLRRLAGGTVRNVHTGRTRRLGTGCIT
jgi:hypothetical protein